MFAKAIDILDVHDCSPGAARLALSWWLANVAGQQVGSVGENALFKIKESYGKLMIHKFLRMHPGVESWQSRNLR